MNFDNFIALLDRPKPLNGGYSSHCPAHEDRTPSLTTTEGEGGAILVKCFAGCSTDDVVAAMGLKMADLFIKSSSTTLQSNGSTKPKLAPAPIDDAVVDQCHAALTQRAKEYLKRERELSDEVIDRYKLGLEVRSAEKRFTIPIRDEQGIVRDIRRWLPPESRQGDERKKNEALEDRIWCSETISHRSARG